MMLSAAPFHVDDAKLPAAGRFVILEKFRQNFLGQLLLAEQI